MSKVVFLRLRNRTLNKFKAVKAKKAVKKVAAKKVASRKIKKTLRVVVKHSAGKVSPQQKSSKSPSPVAKQSPAHKIGARTLSSLIGHRRLFLRNRRLMDAAAHRPMVCAF